MVPVMVARCSCDDCVPKSVCVCVCLHWSIKAPRTVKECTPRECVVRVCLCVLVKRGLIKVHILETSWPLIINKWARA